MIEDNYCGILPIFMDNLVLHPIGKICNNLEVKFKTNHQPIGGGSLHNFVQLSPNSRFKDALNDLDGFDRIWLISWFDRSGSHWRSQVMPPRGPPKRRGVFATRSPHRPNPIGMTCVPLVRVDRDNLRLIIGETDLLDGTPILDIKPYIPEYDSFPDSNAGWVSELNQSIIEKLSLSLSSSSSSYQVTLDAIAQEQVEYLSREHNISFIDKAIEILSSDPSPHPTRRIHCNNHDDNYTIHCGPWRVIFEVDSTSRMIRILGIGPGYPRETLLKDTVSNKYDIHFDAQRTFLYKYPESELSVGIIFQSNNS